MNPYQNYKLETNDDAYEYEKRHHEREENYREELRKEIDRDYFGDGD